MPDSARRIFSVAVGLGVAAHSAPSLNDYINAISRPVFEQRLDEFSSVPEFFIRPEARVGEEWALGLEYGLLVKSYTLTDASGFARSEISYHVHMPTILLAYVIPGEGYRLKLGGGVGYHVGSLTQRFPTFGTEEEFRSGGLAFKLDASGNTRFDDTLYGLIEVDLRWDFLGSLRRGNGDDARSPATNETVNMNFFNVGFKLGVLFQF